MCFVWGRLKRHRVGVVSTFGGSNNSIGPLVFHGIELFSPDNLRTCLYDRSILSSFQALLLTYLRWVSYGCGWTFFLFLLSFAFLFAGKHWSMKMSPTQHGFQASLITP